MRPICAILYHPRDVNHALMAARHKGVFADYVAFDDYYVFRVWPQICLPRFPF
jgi:hypothetical protein